MAFFNYEVDLSMALFRGPPGEAVAQRWPEGRGVPAWPACASLTRAESVKPSSPLHSPPFPPLSPVLPSKLPLLLPDSPLPSPGLGTERDRHGDRAGKQAEQV